MVWRSHLACFALVLLLGGCLTAPVQSPPPEALESPDPAIAQAKIIELEDEISRLEYDIRQFNEELAAAELRLIASETQLARLRELNRDLRYSYEEAVSEVVRAQAKLQGNVGQADAASNIAEAEIALAAVEDGDPALLRQARMQLADASAQFENGNFGGALYLSNQAKRSIADLEEAGDTLDPVAEEVTFAQLLPLWLTDNSNLRTGPGLDFSVITVLEKNSMLQGYSYNGAWVRVLLEDGSDGWVFQSLVSRQSPRPPE